MKKSYYVEQLKKAIQANCLDDRDPAMADLLLAAENNMISEGIAKGCLALLQEEIEKQTDFPVRLHRPPRAEQLYAQGKPDIEVGSLKEGDRLRYGIILAEGRVPHILCTGCTGSGKSTLIRAIIIQVEAYNESKRSKED